MHRRPRVLAGGPATSGADVGRDFGWLWTAFAASTAGTWLALDAFPLIAILVLNSDVSQVSLLTAAGLAVGALIAVPLGPWMEFRRKRPVMVTMDLLRVVVLLSIPAAYALGALTFTHLVLVSIVVAAADITFTAAAGACLKALVRPEDLLRASGRFESTTWTATALGPPTGGAAIGLFGPLTTVVADATSYVLSAFAIRAIAKPEPTPAPRPAARPGPGATFEGWRYILTHSHLRPLFLNTTLVNGLIMATAPLLAVLLLRDLGLTPWQYGLAFGVPCLGGLLGSRLSRPLTARVGKHRVMLVVGTLRVCWPPLLAFVPGGFAGLFYVMLIEFGLITCMGIFNPVFAAHRLEQTPMSHVARTLSAWSVTSKATIAVMTALWGVLATHIGLRPAIGTAGALILLAPLFLTHLPTAATPAGLPDGAPDTGLSDAAVSAGPGEASLTGSVDAESQR